MSFEDISILIKEKSETAFSEIYEEIKSESMTYKDLQENVRQVIETVRYENPSMGNFLSDFLSCRVEQELNNIALINEKKVLYLCDGKIPECAKTSCYKHGGTCRRTTDIEHAVNFEDFMGDKIAKYEEESKVISRKIKLLGEQEYRESIVRIKKEMQELAAVVDYLNQAMEKFLQYSNECKNSGCNN